MCDIPCQQKVLHRTPFCFPELIFYYTAPFVTPKFPQPNSFYYTTPPHLLTSCLELRRMSEPQPPLLLKKVSQCTSNLYCNTPPICIAVLSVSLHSEEREILSVLHPFVLQCASHLYCNTPPTRIAALLRNLGGCGHQNVPHEHVQQCQILPQKAGILLAHTLDFACKRQACRQRAKDADHCNKLEAQICWDSHKWLIC